MRTHGVQLMLGMVLCYTCISLLMQTKDDFRFIIPYVEFAKEVKGLKPYVLDTSVVIDGRIADLVETERARQPAHHAAVRARRAARRSPIRATSCGGPAAGAGWTSSTACATTRTSI